MDQEIAEQFDSVQNAEVDVFCYENRSDNVTTRLLLPGLPQNSTATQRNEELAFEAIAHMEQGNVIALDGELAINAACLGVKLKLPLADSIIYATAQKYDAVVWTQDTDFEGLNDVKFYPKAKAT